MILKGVKKMAKARLDISEVAKCMGLDKQTVRLMIREGVVEWGSCWKRPGSKRYSYIISPRKFYESTGIALREGIKDD